MTKRYLFLFALSTFILAIVWIATNIYHSQATSTIEPILQTQIIQIAPTFDEEAIAELRKRTPVEPLNSAPVVLDPENPDATLTPTPADEGEEDLSPTPSTEENAEINDLEIEEGEIE